MSYTDIVKNTSHISEKDILKKVKVNDIFTPFKEALNNSLEAIKCRNPKNDEYKDARISVNIFVKKDSANELRLDYIEIKDNFHNLFLTKGEDNTYNNSNLWMLSEDFIYYSGKSEEQLCNFKLNNENVFNSEFSAEEERYLLSLGENRKIKRPDILLFPQENKCIIIEFKNVEVNVSDHLNQINKYAYFLRNFTNEKFQFKQFYGYLIGEPIECEDVRAADSDFKSFHDGKGMFRPKKNVVCKNNQNADGELYMEVLPYTELLEKATLRNRIFIEKLGIQDKDN